MKIFALVCSLVFLVQSFAAGEEAGEFSNVERIFSYRKTELRSLLKRQFKNTCKKIIPENAIYALLINEDGSFIEDLKKDRACRKNGMKEKNFCEYFCAHDFVIFYLEIKEHKKKVPRMVPSEYGEFAEGTVGSITPLFKNYSDHEIVMSILNAKIKAKILETKKINDTLYLFSAFYELGKRHASKEARLFLIKQLMVMAPQDASGDGGVSQIQTSLAQFAAK